MPKKEHTMLVATELTTEDMLEIMTEIARKLTWELDRTIKDRNSWKSHFEMYRGAWLREMGGTIVRKSHEIDGFVLRAKEIYAGYIAWKTMENISLNRDPFWMVPDPDAPKLVMMKEIPRVEK
jgi:hypothetical protein